MEKFQEYISTVTSKGQVTVPVEVRRILGLKPQDKLVFRIVGDKVEVGPLPMTFEEAYKSVKPLITPEDFATIRATAREERAEKFATSKKPR
jgi:AbrB family looped-hinge helix DNA binding protein